MIVLQMTAIVQSAYGKAAHHMEGMERTFSSYYLYNQNQEGMFAPSRTQCICIVDKLTVLRKMENVCDLSPTPILP
jgi:hypothetical protein